MSQHYGQHNFHRDYRRIMVGIPKEYSTELFATSAYLSESKIRRVRERDALIELRGLLKKFCEFTQYNNELITGMPYESLENILKIFGRSKVGDYETLMRIIIKEYAGE